MKFPSFHQSLCHGAILFTCLFAGTVNASERPGLVSVSNPSIFHPPPSHRIDPLKYERFSMLEREMQFLIAAHGDPSIRNELCAVGYGLDDKSLVTVVIWKNQNWLIVWDGGDPEAARENFKDALSLSLSPTTNMNTSLVDKQEYGGTRTLARKDAEATVADCEKNGKQYAIEPFTPPVEDD